MKFFCLSILLCLSQAVVFGQKNDTIRITPEFTNTKALIPGTHRWLLYSTRGVDSPRTRFSIWSRTITKTTHNGKDAIEVAQLWEDKDGIWHTTRSLSDAKDFRTLFHDSWWRSRGKSTLDFEKAEFIINNKPLTKLDTAQTDKRRREAFDKAISQYTLNWHLDLEVFPLLPYKNNRTFLINFYDPGLSEPKWIPYTVTGTGTLPGLDGQLVDCWLLEHTLPNNYKEVFWVSKKTKEVLKLENQIGDNQFSYKIKLAFSK
jgi:hypothetical protein